MSDLAVAEFSYDLLDRDTANFVHVRASEIHVLGKRAATDIITIGQYLTEVKERIGHGNWLPWLEAEFGWTIKTAQNFMRVYGAFKNENFSHLEVDISSLYLLAAPSMDDEVRERVMERAEEGEPVTRETVKREQERQKITKVPKALLKYITDAGMTTSVIMRGGGMEKVCEGWTRELAQTVLSMMQRVRDSLTECVSVLEQYIQREDIDDE